MALSHAGIAVLVHLISRPLPFINANRHQQVLIFQSKWSAHPFAAWVAVGCVPPACLAQQVFLIIE